MVGHAVSNVVPVVAANRIGTEHGQTFYGTSFITDERGGFRGIAPDPELAPAHRAQLADAVVTAARAIGATGYSGPFAIDAFIHPGGLHVSEINARYTFGFVAHARGGSLTGA